jgi:autotransporter-associated beta strand protein
MPSVSQTSSPALRSLFALLIVAAAWFIGARSAHAVTKTFNNSATGWNTGTAWTPNGAPAASDDVLFVTGDTRTITLNNSNATIQYITYPSTDTRNLVNSTTATTSNLTLSGVDGNGNLINMNSASGTPIFRIQNGNGTLNLVLGASGNMNVTASNTLVLNSAISETGGARSITKTGSGSLTISGANSYTGGTSVTGGTLSANNTSGSALGSGLVAVSSGTLNGTGTIVGAGVNVSSGLFAGNLTLGSVSTPTPLTFSGGTFSPGGGAVGSTTLAGGGAVVFSSATTLNYDLNGSNTAVGPSTNDLLTGAGDLTLAGTLNVSEAGPAGSFAAAPAGSSWRLINYAGLLTGPGLTLGSMPALVPGYQFAVDTSVAGQVNLVISAVPEASAALFLGAASALSAVLIRRKSRASGC